MKGFQLGRGKKQPVCFIGKPFLYLFSCWCETSFSFLVTKIGYLSTSNTKKNVEFCVMQFAYIYFVEVRLSSSCCEKHFVQESGILQYRGVLPFILLFRKALRIGTENRIVQRCNIRV